MGATGTMERGLALEGVAILRPGSYRDMQGRSVQFSEEQLRAIAAGYDPQYHLATLNLDHADSGPALGHITALRYEQGLLRADITGLPDWLATQLREGRWPARSAEIWPELDGRGPYLRGLALLGARAPAVRGLPAMPAPVLAAEGAANVINVFMEGEMEGMTVMQDSAELSRLSAENMRLSSELATLQRREAEGRVDELLASLRTERRISPGMERSGLRELLLLLSARSATAEAVCLADGSELSPVDCLEGLLRSLPPLQLDNELADGGADFEQLSAFEREIAGSLGLSDTEYAQIRDGRTAWEG